MRRRHFEAFRPVCPRCAAAGAGLHPLLLTHADEVTEEHVASGILLCSAEPCRYEYPIVGGIPIIVADLPRMLTERAASLLLRQDLDPAVESLLGDVIGPDSWFDALRQSASTYGWDAYADLDAAEPPTGAGPLPGAARRCLGRLLELAPPSGSVQCALDLGCAAGRTSFDLAVTCPHALVLGIDLDLGLLRMAQAAGRGSVSYPRRRIGLVYDRRHFAVTLPGTERVDFWACDASALPFTPGIADVAVALNLLDCVPSPASLLAALAALLRTAGRLLLSTPYDWATRATAPEHWIGGHSQRASHAGAGETFLRALLTEGGHSQAARGLTLLAEEGEFPWHTRLHDRSAVAYRTHLLALARQ